MPNKQKKKKPAKKPFIKAKKKAGKPKKFIRKKHERAEKPEPREAFDWERAIVLMTRKGQQRGFVTEAEIVHGMPYLEENISAVEKLYNEFDRLGIEVVDQ